jgi:4'-phosphopantetheinyl transferase
MMLSHTLEDFSFELPDRIVQVWALYIRASDQVTARFELVLTPDEAVRAARFRFEHLQRAFILKRGALRILLGRYLDTAPESIQFAYNANGKPSLSRPAPVRFNTSHSGGIALFAFTLESEIGVDVEQIRRLQGIREIAGRFFCREEATELMALPAVHREAAFFRCWTRKEAYVKAVGEGLSVPLDAFRVTLRPGEPARLVHRDRDTVAAESWTLNDLQLPPQYAAALAYRDAARPVDVRPFVTPAELLTFTR